MAKSKSRFAHLDGPVVPENQQLFEKGSEVPQEAEGEAGIVQLNLKVSPALRSALRMKALKLGIPPYGSAASTSSSMDRRKLARYLDI